MKRKYALLLLMLAPLLLGIGPFLAQAPSVQTTSTPVLGAELVVNGDGESTAGWSVSRGSIASVAGGVTGNCFQLTSDGTGGVFANRALSGVAAGMILRLSGYAKDGNTASQITTNYYQSAPGLVWDTTTASWVQKTGHQLAAAAGQSYYMDGTGISTNLETVLHDEMSVKAVSLSSLLAPTRPFSGSGRFYTTATTANCATGEWLGTAAYVDDTRNPTKGVFAYLNRTTGKAELRILTAQNTWTSLINTAFTFGTGKVFYLDYNASTMVGKIYYDGVQIGANQDLSAYTWINQNRKHAIFSTTAVTPGSVVYSYVQQ